MLYNVGFCFYIEFFYFFLTTLQPFLKTGATDVIRRHANHCGLKEYFLGNRLPCKSSNGRRMLLSRTCWRSWSLVAVPELESETKGVVGFPFPKASRGAHPPPATEAQRRCMYPGSHGIRGTPPRLPVPRLLCSVRTDLQSKGPFLKKPCSKHTFVGPVLRPVLPHRTPVQAAEEDDLRARPLCQSQHF